MFLVLQTRPPNSGSIVLYSAGSFQCAACSRAQKHSSYRTVLAVAHLLLFAREKYYSSPMWKCLLEDDLELSDALGTEWLSVRGALCATCDIAQRSLAFGKWIFSGF